MFDYDIGWEIQARRDTAEQKRHARDRHYAECIVYQGELQDRSLVIRKLRALICTWEDEGRDVEPITAAIQRAKELKAGEVLTI